MSAGAWAWAALALDLVGLVLAFGVRTWLQVRRTGTSGFRGISGRPGSLPWWGGVLFPAAVLLGWARVLRPGGQLLLADHVVSTSPPVRLLQRVLEVVTIPIGGENFRRRPVVHVRNQGFAIEQQERFKLGIVERVAARKPST